MRRAGSDDELEGLLARCVEEISECWDGREWFTQAQNHEQVRDTMKRAAEPAYDFAQACLKEDEDGSLPKDKVREAYREYARVEDLPVMDESRSARNSRTSATSLSKPVGIE